MKLQRRNIRVQRRLLLRDKVIDGAHRDLPVGFEEEDGRVALGNIALGDIDHARWDIDLVHTCSYACVGPAREGVARVDDHLVVVRGQDRRKREWVASILALEAAQTVLEEQRDDAEVGVWPCAFDGAGFELVDRYGRVVEHAELGCGRLAPLDKRVFGHPESDFACSHDVQGYFLCEFEVSLNEVLIAREVLGAGVLVGEFIVARRTAVKVFLNSC